MGSERLSSFGWQDAPNLERSHSATDQLKNTYATWAGVKNFVLLMFCAAFRCSSVYSVKVRRGRREGDGTEMSWQSVPLTPIGFVLRAPHLLTSFLLFCTSEDIRGRAGGGGLTKSGWRGRGGVCHDIFWRFSSCPLFGVPFWPSPTYEIVI